MRLKNLTTKFLGRNAIYFKSIDSTQSEIWRLIEKNNIQNGTLVMADKQTNGQGTHGKKWYTDKENNIAFSIEIEPNCKVQQLDGITKEIAQIIVEIMLKMYGIKLNIKEPNDLYINNKKVGGILTQTKVIGNVVQYLVIGIGINTSQRIFTEEISKIATSIKKEFNVNVNVEDFIANFCNEFEKTIEERSI